MRRKLYLILVVLHLVTIASYAGEIVLTGVYKGKNLYVQNPFTNNMKDYCTNEVYVNGTKTMSNITTSAYEIDLSHLALNAPVTIRITHKDDCQPKVINASVITQASSFQFTAFTVDENHINWTTKSEKVGSKMFLEQFTNNNWVSVKEIPVKGAAGFNTYSLPEIHFSGINKYRIKYMEKDGATYYSKVVEFTSSKAPVTFYPTRVESTVTFSREVSFEVLDAYGHLVKKGFGSSVDMTGLAPGVYYLNFDNLTHKVLKK